MTIITRQPALVVTLGVSSSGLGGTVLPKVLSARCSLGTDLRVAEATVVIPVDPSPTPGIGYWQTVSIQMSGTQGGTLYRRFLGYIVERDYSLYPRAITLICRGRLVKAQMTECNTRGGVNLTNGLSGAYDEDIITSILTGANYCGFPNTTPPLLIGGNHILMGTKSFLSFIWSEGETALSYIERIDAVSLGFRTFDTVDGLIARQNVSTSTIGTPTAAPFVEGVDIETGTAAWSVLPIKNRVIAVGLDTGAGLGPVVNIQQATNPNIPTPPQYISARVDSPLIERATPSDPGSGVTAQDVATWFLTENNHQQVRLSFTTPRDDLIAPNDPITVQGAGAVADRLGVATNFFVQRVDCDISEQNVFTQTLTCLSGAS